jgi:hypothetical protein
MASACELFVKTGDLADRPCVGAQCADGAFGDGADRTTGGSAATEQSSKDDGAASNDGTVEGVTCDGGSVGSDPLNCGTRGHSCLGGACVAGLCQPVMMASFAPIGLLVDPPYVYIYDFGTIERVPSMRRISLASTRDCPHLAGRHEPARGRSHEPLLDDRWRAEQIATIGKDRSNPHVILPTVGEPARGAGVLAIKGQRLYSSEPREYEVDAAAGYALWPLTLPQEPR